jgi:hypothetical protein
MGQTVITRKSGGGAAGLVIDELIESYVVAAGETISAGTFVEFVSALTGSKAQINTGTNTTWIRSALISTNKAIVVYNNPANSNFGTANVISVSGLTITVGTSFVFESANTTNTDVVGIDTDKAIVVYQDQPNSNQGTSVVLNITGTTIGAGSLLIFNTTNSQYNRVVKLATNKALVLYRTGSNGNALAKVLSVSGTTISQGSQFTVEAADSYYYSLAEIGTDKAIAFYNDYGNSQYATARVLSVSGTSISGGTHLVVDTIALYFNDITYFDTDKAIVSYRDENNTVKRIRALTVSGTTITAGTSVTFETNGVNLQSLKKLDTDKVILTYGFASLFFGTYKIYSVSGSTLTLFKTGTFTSYNAANQISSVFLETNKIISFHTDPTNSGRPTALVIQIGDVVRNTTAEYFNALAKTGGTAGNTIEIYVNE